MTTSHNPDNEPSTAAPREETIQSPHDRLLNQTLQQIDAARTLLANHLPTEVVQHLQFHTLAHVDLLKLGHHQLRQPMQHLQFHTLAHVDTSFIDQNLRRRFADRLFSVQVSDDVVQSLGLKTRYVYIFVLVDHKSTDDPETLIQMLGYIVRIWENALASRQPLVPIVPWVIYNGVGPWRSSRSLAELIPVPESWRRYVPALELAILDVSRMADTEMVGDLNLQVTLTLLKYGRGKNLDNILRSLFELLSEVLSPQQARDLLDTIRVYVMSVNPVVGEEKMSDLVTEFWPVQPEPGSVADQLIKKGEARGIALGEKRASVKTIRMLQSILGTPESSDEEFADKNVNDLEMIIETLRTKISNRPST